MATATAHPLPSAVPLPGRRYDHRFFASMSVMMLLTVLYGFAPTYYLAGGPYAPLPSPIIHVHAVVFSLWILFLITQTTLTSTGNVAMHRKLGIGGMVLAGLMLPLGLAAATDSLARGLTPVPGRDPRMFYIVPTSTILFFAILMYLAFRFRKDSATHKRLVYIATANMLLAAVARMQIPHVYRNPMMAALLVDIFLLALIAYDWWSTRAVHRATMYAGAALVFLQFVRLPIAHTAAWIHFATWVQSVAR